MRLSKDIVKHIADAVVANLESKSMAKLLKPRDAVFERVEGLITEDLLAEDRLDEEVEKILASHESEISSGQMDYRRVFELTKQKLAKERGIVL